MLTHEQLQSFHEVGYLLVSGLIPPATAAAAEAAIWRRLEISPTDPAAWAAVARGHHSLDSPELMACFTPGYLAAAARLAGADPATFRPPRAAYTINLFPMEEPWRWPSPHIDHAIKDHDHKVFPRPFRVASMCFLHDVEPHGGGTVVWPGSHRRLEALARGDPERYELMWTLNQSLKEIDLAPPVELTPRGGDVLFYHYLCAHAGSMNTRPRPRFAMNMKW